MLTTRQIRQTYLDFFKARGHAIVPSASIIPENDSTTLFTGSGMQPMVPYLLGQKHPLGTRIANSQKSFRSQDIEEVGDNSHTTFFEMLGNWSLGDYFKKEQISWIFSFLVDELKFDPNRLYFTCFRGNSQIGIPQDEEAAKLWQKLLNERGVEAKIVDFPERDGIQGGRIFYYDEEKNWWSRVGVPSNMPIGEPGGPDTEMFWDFGEDLKLHDKWLTQISRRISHVHEKRENQLCHVNCDCGRFIEIGNNVFMEYQRTKHGFEKLKQQNVDFGGGLERIATALRDDPDIFKIDVFDHMREKLMELSGKKYGEQEADNYAFRVILDHLRAATFLIGDGAVPANKDQGYFTRRLIRRSIRFAHTLGIDINFCASIAEQVIGVYTEIYPELENKKEKILNEILVEEKKFSRTLKQGLRELNRLIEEEKPENPSIGTVNAITPKKAFDLYQTYGFPLELINEELAKHALFIDEKEFKRDFQEEFRKHQELSRAGSEQKFKGGLADHSEMSVKYHTATHLLHATLKKILGDQVEQKGSNITSERLRFDFSYPEKMTRQQIKQTEDLINAAIVRDYSISWQEMTMAEALEKKATGLFADKYGEKVKVYTIGDVNAAAAADPAAPSYSREICGGPHVEHTGVLGKFKILKEEACGAGIRRIKAILE